MLDHPQVTIFHRGRGRAGDTALVAEASRRAIGAVWYRFFAEAEHGDGYVEDETPELAVAVAQRWRGRGVGGRLLEAMHERARQQGLARIALSVDRDNPAKRLYERLAYVELDPGDPRGRMVVEL